MVKKICIYACIILLLVGIFMMFKITKVDKKKIRDLKYEVLLEEDIPEEIFRELSAYKDNVCKCSYICNDKLYIVICYGNQEVSGYTIEVNDIYESTNAIYVETTLMGPTQEEQVAKGVDDKSKISGTDCPYIVLKLSLNRKTVIFI